MNENDIDNLDIDTMQKEYDVILQKYQEAVNTYISVIKSNTSKKMVSLKGRTWWGSSALSEQTVNTKEECETMCASNDKCSGATFNPSKRYCWLRQGDGQISAGLDDDYALLTEEKNALIVMQSLNKQLLDLNTQINEKIIVIEPNTDDKNQKQEQLTKAYHNLLNQKIKMEQQLQEYNVAEQDEYNQSLFVTQQSMLYYFWLILAIIIIIYTIKALALNIHIFSISFVFILLIFLLFKYFYNH